MAAAKEDEEMDFFEMLGMKTRDRLDEQRSTHIPDAEKPMVLNLELLKNQLAGKAIIDDHATTFPCFYMGHVPCKYSADKEKMCNELVFEKCQSSKNSRLSSIKNPFQAQVKCDTDGVHFTIGSTGAVTVNIDLTQVACVSLCPKKPGGDLKIIAILCRSPKARDGKKGVGELGMVLHMCRLKTTNAMWNFQRAFVDALKEKFPEFHKPGGKRASKKAADKSDGGSDENESAGAARAPVKSDAAAASNSSVLMSAGEEIKPKTKMPRAHKVFVKSKEEILQRDEDMAARMQKLEEAKLQESTRAEDADAAFARQLQEAEDAAMARKESLSFDDLDPLNDLAP